MAHMGCILHLLTCGCSPSYDETACTPVATTCIFTACSLPPYAHLQLLVLRLAGHGRALDGLGLLDALQQGVHGRLLLLLLSLLSSLAGLKVGQEGGQVLLMLEQLLVLLPGVGIAGTAGRDSLHAVGWVDMLLLPALTGSKVAPTLSH